METNIESVQNRVTMEILIAETDAVQLAQLKVNLHEVEVHLPQKILELLFEEIGLD